MSIFDNDSNSSSMVNNSSKPLVINVYTVFFNNGDTLDIAAVSYDYGEGTLDFFDSNDEDAETIVTFKEEVIFGVAMKNKSTLKSGFGYMEFTPTKAEYHDIIR